MNLVYLTVEKSVDITAKLNWCHNQVFSRGQTGMNGLAIKENGWLSLLINNHDVIPVTANLGFINRCGRQIAPAGFINRNTVDSNRKPGACCIAALKKRKKCVPLVVYS
ncbi:hypothetical protein ES703_117553 [subsurface metagenome]